ncbi:folliculin-interacting protein 1 [Copidosoma floridanum]|uniref:folliculin-interacting protein 1 n=1 Tax=Copidosoma floridanum TaxID=29053 RepID=UPI0006C9D20E|nr:folliculin-interacting protein 1 [Copidosoma floridanum]
MAFIAKFWSSGKNRQQEAPDAAELDQRDKRVEYHDEKRLQFGADPVRILLFRDCDSRVSRKLLFDSMSTEGCDRCNADNLGPKSRNGAPNRGNPTKRIGANNKRSAPLVCEHEKQLKDDTSVLCAMTFGSVSMTYKGPSFKIHVVSSPASVVCAKVFPSSEHSVCGPSQRQPGAPTTFDSTTNSSLRTQISGSASSASGVIPTLRKTSTSSSVGGGWDLEVPRLGSSQSLDGNGSSSGSLSSLRRRWQRALSTSLARSESEEGSTVDGAKHGTRLALVLLVHLPSGHESEATALFLEHAPLLEGMLDRLRYSCGEGPRRNLVYRLYRATGGSTLRLLSRITRLELGTTKSLLVWHDALLNSVHQHRQPCRLGDVHRTLQRMCWLLERYDTKSTNFFVSTIVTAVLTHHLGWVHTAPPCRDRQAVEKMGKQYSCNPLWAQLADLYGAVGTPTRLAHTVIAGEPDKVSLIESVLHFLSYFVRSGVVGKHPETRCPEQEDFREAKATLERALRRKHGLSDGPPKLCSSGRPGGEAPTGSAFVARRTTNGAATRAKLGLPEEEPYEETSSKKLKRSGTMGCRLDEVATVDPVQGQGETGEERQASSKVKIVVGDGDERDKLCNFNKQQLQKPNATKDLMRCLDSEKLAWLDRQKFPPASFAASHHPANSKTLLNEHVAFAANFTANADAQVLFTLGDDKPCTPTSSSVNERLESSNRCQCSYTFMPSTSAELPEAILRKIIQRNFPESSKNMRPTATADDDFGVCLKCRRGSSRVFENGKLLETPTNATEVLRGCTTSNSNGPVVDGPTAGSTQPDRSDTLEALLEANGIIELPMPRTKKAASEAKTMVRESVGFPRSLIGLKVETLESGYTYGMVMQGLVKKTKPRASDGTPRPKKEEEEEEEWWLPIRENLGFSVKFPVIDQPVAEALCIIGDLDNWQVGLLSNTSSATAPVTVGMSRLVSNMLEAFVCMWRTFRSPEICIKFLESRLREVWLRSRSLADFLLTDDLDDASVSSLTDFLDVDVADLPLLVAVASTHTPRISQRLGLTLA